VSGSLDTTSAHDRTFILAALLGSASQKNQQLSSLRVVRSCRCHHCKDKSPYSNSEAANLALSKQDNQESCQASRFESTHDDFNSSVRNRSRSRSRSSGSNGGSSTRTGIGILGSGGATEGYRSFCDFVLHLRLQLENLWISGDSASASTRNWASQLWHTVRLVLSSLITNIPASSTSGPQSFSSILSFSSHVVSTASSSTLSTLPAPPRFFRKQQPNSLPAPPAPTLAQLAIMNPSQLSIAPASEISTQLERPFSLSSPPFSSYVTSSSSSGFSATLPVSTTSVTSVSVAISSQPSALLSALLTSPPPLAASEREVTISIK
jgi:hypothetical protein